MALRPSWRATLLGHSRYGESAGWQAALEVSQIGLLVAGGEHMDDDSSVAELPHSSLTDVRVEMMRRDRSGRPLAAALVSTLPDPTGASGFSLSAHGGVVGGWTLGECIGAGGFGRVYRATPPRAAARRLDLGPGDQFVLKLCDQPIGGARDIVVQFERELAVLSQLAQVQGIVPIVEYGYHGLVPYLVMPEMRESLGSVLKREGALAPAQAVALISPVARVLTAAHARGIYHRDIRPSNVLVDEHGGLALTDFGIAVLSDSPRVTAPAELVGYRPFMSPEALSGLPADADSDLWMLSCTLFQMVTGVEPFGRAHRHGRGAGTLIGADRVPMELKGFFGRAFNDRRERRFRNADAWLTEACSSCGSTDHAAAEPRKSDVENDRVLYVSLMAAIALGVLVIAFASLIR